MRIKVGRIVNADAEVNLADLSPIDRIVAAATNAYHNTGVYRRRVAETEEKKEEQKRKLRESLVDSILNIVTAQLEGNTLLKEKGDQCVGVLVEVPSKYNSILGEVVQAHEFDAYEVTVIPPNRVVSKFAEPSHLLHFCNRGGLTDE